jgi:ClpP class serine protease
MEPKPQFTETCQNDVCIYCETCTIRNGALATEETFAWISKEQPPEGVEWVNFAIRQEDAGPVAVISLCGRIWDASLELLERAEGVPDLSGVLLLIDSQGGSALVKNKAQLTILRLRRRVPVVAFAYDALSAAFEIGVASDLFFGTECSVFAGFGVCAFLCVDRAKPVLMTSWQSPQKCTGVPFLPPFQIEESKYLALQQTVLDQQYEVGLCAVALLRVIDPETVRGDLDGRELTAERALELKLIDGILPEELVYLKLLELISKRRYAV